MQADFWRKKWQGSKQGFNQAQPNALMVEYFNKLTLEKGSQIFVPLAGKSIDMLWLANQGYNVVGVELVESAVKDFFTDNNITVNNISTSENNELTCYWGTVNGQKICLWAGDIFDLTQNDIGKVAGIYDRAALVALPDNGDETSLRRRYTKTLIELTDTAPQLLLNFTVNEANINASKGFDKTTFGPPFLVDEDDILSYYQHAYQIIFIAKGATNNTDVLVNQAWQLHPLVDSTD